MKGAWYLALAACVTELPVAPDVAVLGLPERVVAPADNPSSPERVALGKLLFWDPILSGDRDVACATCHHPDFAYADGAAVSVGVGGRGLGPARVPGAVVHQTPRSSMPLLGVGFNGPDLASPESALMFWDGRTRSLEQQALLPIENVDEMRGTGLTEDEIFPELIVRLRAIPEYVDRFAAAFGPDSITRDNVGRALAAFERTLVSPSSFDRFMAGDDDALSHDAKRGLAVFINDGCSKCHSGPMLSDFELHTIGAPSRPGAAPDAGDGAGRFRTPTLRNIMRTAPYMHDGALETLEEVLEFYSTTLDPTRDPALPPDGFPQRFVDVLLPFFESLSDGDFDRDIPAAVPSGLPVGGRLE